MANGCLPVLLGWANSTTSGHSKVTKYYTILFAFIFKDYITQRVTTNAIILVAYGIGNAAGPFMWKQQYRPR